VQEYFPSAEVILEEFDRGSAVGMGWIFPDGKRTAVKLAWTSAVGGKWVEGDDDNVGFWEVKPTEFIENNTTEEKLRELLKSYVSVIR
jgi:hypothetical protein